MPGAVPGRRRLRTPCPRGRRVLSSRPMSPAGLAALALLLPGAGPPAAGTAEQELATFRIALPAPFRLVDRSDCVRDPQVPPDYCYGMARFEDGQGRWLQVLVDYPPTEVSAHAYWTLTPSADGTGLVIGEEEPLRRCPLTLAGGTSCGPQRGFRVAAWVELRGHHFLFGFGNDRTRKGVDLAPFREMLRSFRAR